MLYTKYQILNSSNLSCLDQDIRVTRVGNGQDGAVEEFTASRSKRSIVARIVVDGNLGQHGQILDLRLAKLWAVGCNQHHLGLVLTQGLDGSPGPKNGLARLHDQLETRVHRVLLLLLYS